MITRIKLLLSSIKRKWLAAFTVPLALAGSLAGADISKYEGNVIQAHNVAVGNEQVKVEQKGNVVEVVMPWKGEPGITVKYDMGEPDAAEKLSDQRKAQVITEKVNLPNNDGYKIDIILKEKPQTNKFCYYLQGWEDYDFFYQPELTEKEIAAGFQRPEEMVGSYAIYHKSKANGRYQTGKFAHIPFPYIWELGNEQGKIRAEDMTFADGQLCVVAPQKFLDTAQYPVRIDPTFGFTSIGGSSASAANSINCSSFTGASGIGIAIAAYLQSSSVTGIKANAYLASDSSQVTNAQTNEVVPENSTRWVGFPFSSAPTFTGTDYYLCVWGSGALVNVYYDTGGTDIIQALTYGSWPSPLAGAPSGANLKFSIYVIYTCTDTGTCTDSIEAPGTYSWTAPTGVTSADVACWGGGGAGDRISGSAGGGGGGGAFASSTVSIFSSATYTVTVGAGGISGTAPTAGGDSLFASSTNEVLAKGGSQASDTTGGGGGATTTSVGMVKFKGGNGGNGDGTGDAGGGGGGAAGPSGAGGNGATASTTTGGGGGGGNGGADGSGTTGGSSSNGGAGGTGDSNGSTSPGGGYGGISLLGGGGGGGNDDGDPGGDGGYIGGGGGGSEISGSNNEGGDGGYGRCVITYTIPEPALPVSTTRRILIID